MARAFVHPAPKDFSLDAILYALSDPVRRSIVLKLLKCKEPGMSCSKGACETLSPSTVSFHYKILRESGLILSKKVGVEVISTLRLPELNKRFPALVETILRHES